MPGGTRAIGTVAEPRADSVGADPAPRDVVRRVRGSWKRSSDPGARLRIVIDLDETLVVVGDLLSRRLALQVARQEALQGVPPDRAADREADHALDRRGLPQPVVDLVVAGAAAQQHRDDALATLA